MRHTNHSSKLFMVIHPWHKRLLVSNGSMLKSISGKTNQIKVSLHEVQYKSFPCNLLVFWSHIIFPLCLNNAFSQILNTSSCSRKIFLVTYFGKRLSHLLAKSHKCQWPCQFSSFPPQLLEVSPRAPWWHQTLPWWKDHHHLGTWEEDFQTFGKSNHLQLA